MLLFEILGVLIILAICTITIWLTLGHHIAKMLAALKNADRNVQVAVAIVIGLLLLAFGICQVTNWRDSCGCASNGSRLQWLWPRCCPPKTKPKTSHMANIISQIKKAISYVSRKSPCVAKRDIAPCRRKSRYTDCEGRAIFINARRYAIPTEMKQPPTIVLWLIDVLGRLTR